MPEGRMRGHATISDAERADGPEPLTRFFAEREKPPSPSRGEGRAGGASTAPQDAPSPGLPLKTGSLTGRQGANADGRTVAISHSVVLRFRNDVSPGDRIVYRGRNLDVVSAADLNGRRAYLSCACSETSFTG